MSKQEIMTALPKLSRPELEEVGVQLRRLLDAPDGERAETWGQALLEVAGSASGLPSDLARNHDHYLHGTARR